MKNINIEDIELAYIAGFIDADGSIMSQIIRNKTYKYNFSIRISLVFYQKTINHWILLWLKKKLIYGTIRKRKDGVSEYIILSAEPVKRILLLLRKYIRLKRKLLNLVLKIIENKKNIKSKEDFIEICKLVDETITMTYSKRRLITSKVVIKELSEQL